MKNFMQDIITGILSVMATVSGLMLAFIGWGIFQGSFPFGWFFILTLLVFLVTLILVLRRKGGLFDFFTDLFPWS